MDEIFYFLKKSRVEESTLKELVVPALYKFGYRTIADLRDLERNDLNIEGLSQLDIRRVLNYVGKAKTDLQPSLENTCDDYNNGIVVRYVLCTDEMFSADIEEREIRIADYSSKTMKSFIYDLTKEVNSKYTFEVQLELYTCEGYPMHVNRITEKANLSLWGIEDGELVYVMIRRKDQIGEKEFAALPPLHHNLGSETLTVEMPFQEKFTVKTYIGIDSPEDIAQKISSRVTEVSAPYMTLFIRRGSEYERLSAFSEIEDGDIVRVVLRNPNELVNPRSTDFGHLSYSQMVKQSKNGLSKFFSILKFLRCSSSMNSNFEFEKFLACVQKITKFPPLVYSLRVLQQQSWLSIAGWAALVEGFYFFFKSFLDVYTASVPEDQVFEFSDYLFGFLIEKSIEIVDVSSVEYDYLSFICPFSGKRILHPVFVTNDGICDMASVETKKAGVQISDNECNIDILKKLMICFPWESDDKVCNWSVQVDLPNEYTLSRISWSDHIANSREGAIELTNCLHQLSIMDPRGLFAGKECLSFVENGRFVYFLGFSKGTDDRRRFYDPISDQKSYTQLKNKSDLECIGSNLQASKNVSKDLSIAWKIRNQPIDPALKISTIIVPEKSIQWKETEAIVVLLDRSSSMSGNIFNIPRLNRCEVAKQLFDAFATRTQAYGLHHAFGLTTFDHFVETKLFITTNPEKFEESLHGITPRGSTCLTEAIVNGVSQLKNFHCQRRILCLTDGENNGSPSYDVALQAARSYQVIVDTVLLTHPGSNDEQKALSHATGGICVLPRSISEAFEFFEMDGMLTVKYRTSRATPQGSMSSFLNLLYYPYNTRKDFEFFPSVKKTTTSIDRYLNSQQTTRSNTVSISMNRIVKELHHLHRNPHRDIRVFPNQLNSTHWIVVMRGPEESAYEGGTFLLKVTFPDKYPSQPPEITFLTPIYHCNISRTTGRICHSILKESYTPVLNMLTILCHIYGLLMCPDIDSPLDGVLVDEYGYLRHRKDDASLKNGTYFHEARSYFKQARDMVLKTANSNFGYVCKQYEQ